MKFCFDTLQFIDLNKDNDKPAVIGENHSLSWTEFQSKVNELALHLTQEIGIVKGLPVMIYGHKNAEMISAIYACMQSGITYIPIDEVYPKDRIERIAEISGAQLLINCSEFNSIAIKDLPEIKYEHSQPLAFHTTHLKLDMSKCLPDIDPIVYIIFTSGSTGEPKGVQISRQAVLSFIRWMTNDFGFKADDVFANIAVFSFDLSVFELMTFSALGATLLLNGKRTIEQPDNFLHRIQQYKASVWISTPSFSLMYARESFQSIAENIRVFLFCGEVLPHSLAASLKQHYSNARVINTYGPTEATVATTLVEIDEQVIAKYNWLPVGYPKRESEITIEDNEIVIHGEHVSIGYLNRSDLNAIKFGNKNNTRFFRTGDLGYFEDGMLFCKGRNDDQIKLRGFRIELNEITSKIDTIEFIDKSETIALKRNEEVKKIVSLVTLKYPVDFDVKQAVLETLKKTLPEYMVPSDIKVIDKIPLNQNGKADRNKLIEMYLMK